MPPAVLTGEANGLYYKPSELDDWKTSEGLWQDRDTIEKCALSKFSYPAPNVSNAENDGNQIEKKFRKLMELWRKETQFSSSITEIVMHMAYQRIIGMGPVVIPLILHELEKRPDHWFWALYAITEVDPITPEQRGRVKEMAQAWLHWGKREGYL